MQPCNDPLHLNSANPVARAPAGPMTVPAPALEARAERNTSERPLWIAQRAFAALIEGTARQHGAELRQFRSAQLRSATRRTMSALSADEHLQLQRWLSLQLATIGTDAADAVRGMIARVDAVLAGNLAAALVPTRAELAARAAVAA